MSSSTIILSFTTFVGFAVAITFIVLYLKNKTENNTNTPKNAKFIINFAPHRTGGHVLGSVIKSFSPESNPRSQLFKFITRDRFEKEDGKFEGLKEVSLTTRKLKVVQLPMGDLSSWKDIIIVFPKDATDFPPAFLDTLFGKFMMNYTETVNVMESAINYIKKGNQNTAQIIRELSSEELMSDLLAKQRNGIKALAEESIKESVEKKKSQIKR